MKASEMTTAAQDGFRGFFYPAEQPNSASCILVLLGDEGDDFMSQTCAKWLTRVQDCHALTVAVRQHPHDDTGIHRWPLEHIETAVQWLKKRGISRIGILGMSMQACLALTAASFIPELSLVLALSPNDFIPWGFYQGRLDNASHAEWPSGTSVFTWRGRELPFQPAFLERKAYWNLFSAEKKKYHEMHSISIFERSEKIRPIPENCFIRAEQIRGKIVLTGAEDDSMWNSARYIRRMQERLTEKGFAFPVKAYVYPHGTHLLLPEKMLKLGLSFAGGLVPRMFASGRQHPKECRKAQLALEKQLTADIQEWLNAD